MDTLSLQRRFQLPSNTSNVLNFSADCFVDHWPRRVRQIWQRRHQWVFHCPELDIALVHWHMVDWMLRCRSFCFNVLISFNNKDVNKAIPIPGFLETVTTAFRIYDESQLKLFPDPVFH